MTGVTDYIYKLFTNIDKNDNNYDEKGGGGTLSRSNTIISKYIYTHLCIRVCTWIYI